MTLNRLHSMTPTKLATRLLFASGLLGLLAADAAAQTTIAYWNFNNLPAIGTAGTPGTGVIPTSVSPTSGTASLSLTGWAGTVDDFAGTTLNALNGDVAGASLSLIAGGVAAPFPGNGSFIDFTFSTAGLADIAVTFATRGTSTGFDSGIWSYSLNSGASFTASLLPGTATRSTTFATTSVDFTVIPDIDDKSVVVLRYTLSGSTTAAGNNRIDNLQIIALSAIPEPSTYAAIAGIGALGLAFLARRRRS